MCILYTHKLSRDEICGLIEHYKLVGVEWAEVFEKEMLGKNDEALFYPISQNGTHRPARMVGAFDHAGGVDALGRNDRQMAEATTLDRRAPLTPKAIKGWRASGTKDAVGFRAQQNYRTQHAS